MTCTLTVFDTEVPNSLSARVRNLDYHYMAEQWVQDTATDPHTHDPKCWVVRWELTDDDTGTLLAIWTRPEGDTGFPSLTYTSPMFTGTWEPNFHKVYVAGTRHTPDTLVIVNALRDAGITVTSTWHDNPPGDTAGTPEARRACAMNNYGHMDEATLIVAVPCSTHHLRGAHTEVGYAVGQNKPVVVVGTSGDFNTMTEHPNVTYCTAQGWALIHSIARRPHRKNPTP